MQLIKHPLHQIAKKLAVVCFGIFAFAGMVAQAIELPLAASQDSTTQDGFGDVVDKLGVNLMLVHQELIDSTENRLSDSASYRIAFAIELGVGIGRARHCLALPTAFCKSN